MKAKRSLFWYFLNMLWALSIILYTPSFLFASEIQGKVLVQNLDVKSGKWQKASSHDSVVIFLMGKGLPKSLVSKNVILSQKNKSFMPRVLAVTVGQKVEFRNSDNFHHNVWSLSGAKSFDLGTFKAPNNKSLVFDKVGMVKVFCNIHPQMIATILILPNNKFSVSNAKGGFSLSEIPAGKYKLRAWAEGSKPITKAIELKKDQILKLNLVVQRKLRSIHHLNKHGKPYKKY